ncbi:MAG: hypothetical protein ACOH2N_01310 [Devosia sp.]
MTLTSKDAHAIGVTRILFGLVWLIDAQFKWKPAFVDGFVSYLTGALPGQPGPVTGWIHFWIDIVKVNPVLFAYFVATAETALALALIFGILSNLAYLGGTLLGLVIWTTAEGFGGPYVAGSTDVGTAIIYVFVFVLLYFSHAGLTLGLDRHLSRLIGRWSFIASGPVAADAPIATQTEGRAQLY